MAEEAKTICLKCHQEIDEEKGYCENCDAYFMEEIENELPLVQM